MTKFNQHLITQLNRGRIAIKVKRRDRNDLNKVLKATRSESKIAAAAYDYYYFTSDKSDWDYSNYLPTEMTAVPIADFFEEDEYQTVTREALGEVYDEVCDAWKTKIEGLVKPNLFTPNIKVPDSVVLLAYKSVTKPIQTQWLEKYLPKPKEKVTKEIVRYANIYPKDKVILHDSREKAVKNASADAIAVGVEVKGTYEVEQ